MLALYTDFHNLKLYVVALLSKPFNTAMQHRKGEKVTLETLKYIKDKLKEL